MLSFPNFVPPGRVLVVDDLPTNVKLLATILKLAGFEVATATSGPAALQMTETESFDVVLLDVMMPDMNGFETCRRIRENAATRHLPVVMVTALREVTDRVQAIEAGADDFLTKPVEEVEVVARVNSLVRAKRGRDEVERAYAELRRSEELRDSLTQMLVHDLRTPLTAVLVSLDLLGNEEVGSLNAFQTELLKLCTRGGGNLLRLVNDLLDVAKLESGQMKLERTPVAMPDLAEDALGEISSLVSERGAPIERDWAPALPLVAADADLVKRVLVNLLSNALKFSPSSAQIAIGAELEGEMMRVWVRDAGRGIAPEFQQKVWDKFGQAENRRDSSRTSTGLGLTFCKLVVEAHGGQVGLESELSQGSVFYFCLPVEVTTES